VCVCVCVCHAGKPAGAAKSDDDDSDDDEDEEDNVLLDGVQVELSSLPMPLDHETSFIHWLLCCILGSTATRTQNQGCPVCCGRY